MGDSTIVAQIRTGLVSIDLAEFAKELTANPFFLIALRREGLGVLLAELGRRRFRGIIRKGDRPYRVAEQPTSLRGAHGRGTHRPVEQVTKALHLSLQAIAGVQ